MSDGTPLSTDPPKGKAGDRRSFIGRVAAAGLALTTGGIAASQTTDRGGPVQGVMLRPPAVQPGSEAALSLQGALKLLTPAATPSGRSAVAELRQHKAPRAPLGPSTKGQLLSAIASQPEGASALAALGIAATGVGRGATLFSSSSGLGLALAGDPLAKAYAAGVTLTPAGCEYAKGIVVDHQPIRYFTDCVAMGTVGLPELPSLQSLVLTGQHIKPEDDILRILICGAGTSDITLPYLLEVDLEWAATGLVSQLNGTPLSWSTSSKGTCVALTTLPGGNWQGDLRLKQNPELSEPYWGAFHWLRVTAV